MLYTLQRSLARVSTWVRLKFVAMKLKKLTLWRSRFPPLLLPSSLHPHRLSICLVNLHFFDRLNGPDTLGVRAVVFWELHLYNPVLYLLRVRF